MLLSIRTTRHNRTPDNRPSADAPLHERLFGEQSRIFYVFIGIWTALTAALTVAAAMHAPHRLLEVGSGLALPIFWLLQGSPDRRLQAAALAIMGALIWSEFEVPLVVILAAAVATSAVTMICESMARREVAAMETMTRRERRPNVLRFYAVSACSTALVAVPGAFVVHGFLLGRGWDAQTAGYIIAGGSVLLGYVLYRKVRDELPVPVGG